MLTEYSLSPFVFDFEHCQELFDGDRSAWADKLLMLCEDLFPPKEDRKTPCSQEYLETPLCTVFSNLQNNRFRELLCRIIAKNREYEQHHRCEHITKDLQQVLLRLSNDFKTDDDDTDDDSTSINFLVSRGPCNPGEIIETEDDWIRETNASAKHYPIHRFAFATSKEGCFFTESARGKFWQKHPSTRFVNATIIDQIDALENLWLFSSGIAVVCPRVCKYMSSDDTLPDDAICPEVEFNVRLLNRKIQDQRPFPRLKLIDIHTSYPKNNVSFYSGKEPALGEAIAQYFLKELPGFTGDIRVYLHGKMTERRFLFGDVDDNGDFFMRWVVSATHYYRRDDSAKGSDPHTFSLLGRSAVDECRKMYYKEKKRPAFHDPGAPR